VVGAGVTKTGKLKKWKVDATLFFTFPEFQISATPPSPFSNFRLFMRNCSFSGGAARG